MNLSELLLNFSIHYNIILRKASFNLNLTTSQALHLVSVPIDGISMTSLSCKLGLDSSTLTRNIQKLEKMNLIKRIRGPYDRRVQNIFLTDEGKIFVSNIEQELEHSTQSIINNLDIKTYESLVDIFEKLVWSMDRIRNQI